MPIDWPALGRALERLQIAERKKLVTADGETLRNALDESVPVTYADGKKLAAMAEFNQAHAQAQAVLANVNANPQKEAP